MQQKREKCAFVLRGFRTLYNRQISAMDTAYTQCLGNDKLHQDIIEHEEKLKNRGICEFACEKACW